MVELRERGEWKELEALLVTAHPLLPGEREVYLELQIHSDNVGVKLDASGIHVVPKNDPTS